MAQTVFKWLRNGLALKWAYLCTSFLNLDAATTISASAFVFTCGTITPCQAENVKENVRET